MDLIKELILNALIWVLPSIVFLFKKNIYSPVFIIIGIFNLFVFMSIQIDVRYDELLINNTLYHIMNVGLVITLGRNLKINTIVTSLSGLLFVIMHICSFYIMKDFKLEYVYFSVSALFLLTLSIYRLLADIKNTSEVIKHDGYFVFKGLPLFDVALFIFFLLGFVSNVFNSFGLYSYELYVHYINIILIPYFCISVYFKPVYLINREGTV